MNKESIIDIISELPDSLHGDWIKKNNSYETELCNEMNWIKDTNRYFDAKFAHHRIEIKKGISIWLDLVRYSEIVLKIGEVGTITTFFIPSKSKEHITDIYFVDTNRIIDSLKISEKSAAQLLELKNEVPRQLNAQASLTKKDIEKISFYHHHF